MKTNTMKANPTTTSTTKALTMQEYKHQRQQEMTQAFFELAKAQKDNNRYFNMLYQEMLYNKAEQIVYTCLKARHEKSGLKFLEELQNEQSNDRKARNNTIICEELTNLESLKKSQIKGYLYFKARANKLTLDPIERAVAFTLSKDLNKQAKATQSRINTLEDALNVTLSDRADLTERAIITMLEIEQGEVIPPITTSIIASYGATTKEELTTEQKAQAQDRASYKYICKKVSQEIRHLAHPDANNGHTTKAEPITKAQYNEYLYTYGVYDYNTNDLTLDNVKIPHTKKRTSSSECWITIEQRDTKRHKGYYKVTHYKTTSPYRYFEDYNQDTDQEQDPAYLKVANPIINTFEDIESIKHLCEQTELTTDEQLFLEYFARANYKYDKQADIINYIASCMKISRATTYRRYKAIQDKLTPYAKAKHIIK